MKKPVIIIIGLIYIFAIVVVGFFGIPARILDQKNYVTDIALVFDAKLSKLKGSDTYEYRYLLDSKEDTTFTITASVVPSTATIKECSFEKLDSADFYTFTTEFDEELNTATFAVSSTLGEIPSICIKVSSTDGNKNMFKTIQIVCNGR